MTVDSGKLVVSALDVLVEDEVIVEVDVDVDVVLEVLVEEVVTALEVPVDEGVAVEVLIEEEVALSELALLVVLLAVPGVTTAGIELVVMVDEEDMLEVDVLGSVDVLLVAAGLLVVVELTRMLVEFAPAEVATGSTVAVEVTLWTEAAVALGSTAVAQTMVTFGAAAWNWIAVF